MRTHVANFIYKIPRISSCSCAEMGWSLVFRENLLGIAAINREQSALSCVSEKIPELKYVQKAHISAMLRIFLKFTSSSLFRSFTQLMISNQNYFLKTFINKSKVLCSYWKTNLHRNCCSNSVPKFLSCCTSCQELH